MKKILSFVLALCLLLTLSLTACRKEKQLETPSNVKVSSTGLITWDGVENAEVYEVTVNSNVYTTTNTSYQANTATAFTASVVATAEGYLPSQSSQTVKFTPNITPPPIVDNDDAKILIRGGSEIRQGVPTNLTATVIKLEDTNVIWSVVKGGEYVSVSNSGVVTVKDGVELTGQKAVTVRASSASFPEIYKDHPMDVIVPTVLTQEMLDVFNDVNKVSFEGFVKINAYSAGPISDMDVLAATQINTIHTAMDGTNWYGEFDNTGTGVYQGVYFRNSNGVANQVSISYTNEEELIPMRDENNRIVDWQESGLYNSFKNLRLSDFTFDNDTWRHVYNGGDLFKQRVVASSNPYEFDPAELSLIIDNGEVMGFRAVSKPSKRVIMGYTTVQEMYVVINASQTVNVPSISRYSHEAIHDELQTAIGNMRALNNYTLDFRQTVHSKTAPGGVTSGYEETVTENDCYFRPYDVSIVDGQIVPKFIEKGEYGYRNMSSDTANPLYNSYAFNSKENKYVAGRAFEDTFDNAKPSMNFSAEIFRACYTDEENGTKTYYADPQMSKVATTFYKAVGNDEALYGLFATDMLLSIDKYPPYVVVKDGYIVEAGFFFNLGDMYGDIVIKYSEYDTAQLPENFHTEVTFETRRIPTSWDQLTIIASRDYLREHNIKIKDGQIDENGSVAQDDVELNGEQFLKIFLGREDVSDVPMLTNVLGDTYGFGLTGYYTPIGSRRAYEEINFYYDVPLDADYTITESLQKIGGYLTSLGFERNANGEYNKGDLWIAPVDNQLDLMVHMWRAN